MPDNKDHYAADSPPKYIRRIVAERTIQIMADSARDMINFMAITSGNTKDKELALHHITHSVTLMNIALDMDEKGEPHG